jgi:hypothetical protein
MDLTIHDLETAPDGSRALLEGIRSDAGGCRTWPPSRPSRPPCSPPSQVVAECTFAGLVGIIDNLAGHVELDGLLEAERWR